MPCSTCNGAGHNRRTCPAIEVADREVETKEQELAIAKERRDYLRLNWYKAEKKKTKMSEQKVARQQGDQSKTKTPQEEIVAKGDKLMGTGSESGGKDTDSEGGSVWEQLNVPT